MKYLSPIEIKSCTPYSYTLGMIDECAGEYGIPTIINYLLNYKIPENPVVNPSNTTQVIAPSAVNRTINTVTVNPRNPLYYKVTISGTNSESISIPGAVSATSSTVAAATVAVSNNIVTVTGVAAGTSTITVLDASSNVIAVIYAVVS